MQSPLLGATVYETEFDFRGTHVWVSTCVVENLRCFFIEPANGFFAVDSVYGRNDDAMRFDWFCAVHLSTHLLHFARYLLFSGPKMLSKKLFALLSAHIVYTFVYTSLKGAFLNWFTSVAFCEISVVFSPTCSHVLLRQKDRIL